MSFESGWIARSSPAMTSASLHLFIGVDAPQPLLFDPAIEPVAGDVAPARRALLDLGHDAGLQPCPKTSNLSTRPARNLRDPLPNKNAPTPSTRPLPRSQLKFFELKHQ